MFTKLRDKRLKKGYTNQNMAERLGISKTFYYQIENEKRRLSYDMAVKIADIFNVKPDALFYNDFMEQKRKEN